MKTVGISASWDNSIDAIALHQVKTSQGMKPVGLNYPWDEYLEIIFL